MEIACLDLVAILIPEIWINCAEKTGFEVLRGTARDIADYNMLMKQRLRILHEHKLGFNDIQDIISTLSPLP